MKKINIEHMLDWLHVRGQLKKRDQAQAFLLSQNTLFEPNSRLSVFIQLFPSLIAFFFIGMTLIYYWVSYPSFHSITTLYLGIIGISIGLLLEYKKKQYLHMLSFPTLLVGKLLFTLGCIALPLNILDNPSKMTLGIMLVTLITYGIYPHFLDRLLSCIACLGGIFYHCLLAFDAYSNVYYAGYFFSLLILISFLFTWPKKTYALEPLSYAALCMLGVSALFLNPFPLFNQYTNYWTVHLLYFQYSACLLNIFLFIYLSGGFAQLYRLHLFYACVGLFILSTVASTSILIAIALLVFGYGKHIKTISVLGGILFSISIIEYYYSMPASFLYKSIFSIGIGMFLLGIRIVVQYEHWDKKGA